MPLDLGKILLPDSPPLEIVLRGTVMYLALFVLLRVALKRQSSSLGVSDLLVVVLLADAAQNGMAGSYSSVADGILLVGTVIFWAYALDWLGYHVPRLERWINPPPLPLIVDGRLMRRNMRSELITIEELMTMLRREGIEDAGLVRRAFLEDNGELSIVKRNAGPAEADKRDTGDVRTDPRELRRARSRGRHAR